MRNGGIRVVIYTVNRFWQFSEVRSRCDAVYSDDAIYLRGKQRMLRSPFRAKAPFNGQLENNYYGNNNGRGEFYGTDEWGFDVHKEDIWVGTLQGWASPIGGTFTVDRVAIDFCVRFKAAFRPNSYAWIALTDDDRKIEKDPGVPGTISGLFFTMAVDGQMTIYRSDGSGWPWKVLGTLKGRAIKMGQEISFKVYVLPTTILIFRSDTKECLATADSLPRGAFLHAGVKGLFATFREISIDTNSEIE